ncbi:dTDP-glucose 4,6-dehydratase [Azospirillum endophyticum]
MSRRILVTGGAGFIGSNFVRWMLDRYPDYRITVLDSLTYAGLKSNLPPFDPLSKDAPLSFWLGDVRNVGMVNDLVAASDWIVHFAAETNVTRSIYDTTPFFETDVIGTQTVANAVVRACGRVERFVHISTSEVYGSARAPLMDETHPLEPPSPYASAKCGADRLVYSYWETYGVPATIVRPFNNYGPQQHLEKVLPRFITGCMLGEPLRVHGDGAAARDFVYVDDTCAAVDLILHAPIGAVQGEVFNVASGTSRTVLSIAEDVVRYMGYDSEQVVFVGDRPGQVVRHTGDWSKINRVLGWRPTRTWEQGLADTIAWYKANPDHWREQVWMRSVPIRTVKGTVELH